MAGKSRAAYREETLQAVIRCLEEEGAYGRTILTVDASDEDYRLRVVQGTCGAAFGDRVLLPFDDLGFTFSPAEQAVWAERFLNITGDVLPAVDRDLIEDGLYILATWAHEDGDL